MKKIFKSLVISIVIACSMVVSIFANTVDHISKELLAMGVPSSYVGAVVEYLQKTEISDADYRNAMNYVDQAKSIIGDTKDISKLSSSDKSSLQNLAKKAGNVLGLNVEFGKNTQGATNLVLTDSKGNSVLKVATTDVLEVVTNLEVSEVVELLETMVAFLYDTGKEESNLVGEGSTSNNVDKENFTPVGGELTQTATPYANMMIAGVAMIVVAGGIAVVSKKQFA